MRPDGPLRAALGNDTLGEELEVSTVPFLSVTLDCDGSMMRRND